MSANAALFKDSEGLRYHGLALVYVLLGYALGFVGLFQAAWLLNIAAVVLLAHSMTIAAYLIHECSHNTVFSHSHDNAYLGRFLGWICGSAYGTYEDIRYKHFRHHVDNDDVVWFEYDKFFAQHPRLTNTIKFLEWAYIPAHDLVLHFIMVFSSFIIPQRRKQRARNIVVIAVRGSVFFALIVFYPKVAFLYMLAYLLMMHALRFMDMLQHDYPYNATLFEVGHARHKGNARWEQAHTFSNPVSLRFRWMNWLVLNFGFHNAHHHDMNIPWYRLPDLHRELFGDEPGTVIPLKSQLALYHRNRVRRVHNPQPDDYPQGADYLRAAQAGVGPIGGNAASFLTSF